MKIAIIGNAIPQKNYSQQIDSCEIIIRINRTPHYNTGLTGSKCSVLALQRLNSVESNRFLRPDNQLDFKVISLAKEIWFINYLPESLIKLVEHYKIKDKQILTIDPGLKNIHEIDYYWSKNKRVFSPSTGLAVIHHIINQDRFKNYSKELYNFTWQGNFVHFWDGEQSVINYWQSIGKVKIIN